LAGKKIRCKKCQAIVPVPAAASAVVADTAEPPAPEQEPAPAPTRPAPKGSLAKILLLVGLGVTLFGGCCVGGGLALWFFVVLPARPEAADRWGLASGHRGHQGGQPVQVAPGGFQPRPGIQSGW